MSESASLTLFGREFHVVAAVLRKALTPLTNTVFYSLSMPWWHVDDRKVLDGHRGSTLEDTTQFTSLGSIVTDRWRRHRRYEGKKRESNELWHWPRHSWCANQKKIGLCKSHIEKAMKSITRQALLWHQQRNKKNGREKSRSQLEKAGSPSRKCYLKFISVAWVTSGISLTLILPINQSISQFTFVRCHVSQRIRKMWSESEAQLYDSNG